MDLRHSMRSQESILRSQEANTFSKDHRQGLLYMPKDRMRSSLALNACGFWIQMSFSLVDLKHEMMNEYILVKMFFYLFFKHEQQII